MVRIFAIAATLAAVSGLGLAWFLGRPSEIACGASRVAGDIGGPLELVTTDGSQVTEQDIFTEPSLVYFGYTFCPDVCPFDVSRNADAIDLLAERGHSAAPVFITIDPKRDTPDVLASYAENMHDKMIALTGTPEQIDNASKAYKTYYKAHDDGSEFYLVDHSTHTYLVMPDEGFVEFFRNTMTAEEIANRTACFIENS